MTRARLDAGFRAFARNPAHDLYGWRIANRLHDHPTGCRCPTCLLTVRLSAAVRAQEKYDAVHV